MRRLMIVALLGLLCAGCTALPAEERAFAVALGVSREAGGWTAHARIPNYQKAGEYQTVQGTGNTLDAALAALDASAPMQLHLGQLRLLILGGALDGQTVISDALTVMQQRQDLRHEACLAVTDAPMETLMEALRPAAGTRLSKSLDVMLATRVEEGTVLPATLSEVLRMGERQSPVLINLYMDGEKAAISGAWPVDAGGIVREVLSAQETQLLALMLGQLRSGTLTLPESVIRLTDAQVQTELSMPTLQSAAVRMVLRINGAAMSRDEISASLARACLALLNRLSAMGCDALGLGRQAIAHADSMEHWHEMNWPERLREMDWSVSVGVE